MKKVLVGVCGIGNGHLNRQICVINELIKNNYSVVIATENRVVPIFRNNFPEIKIIDIAIPWIVCDSYGFNYKETLSKYDGCDLFKKFLEFGLEVEKSFNGKPDLIISDYEPNVAQYAYSQNIPLITMEQQSKFLYIDGKKMERFSIEEEKYRLDYFFPRFEKKIISSFFPLEIENKNVIQVPPIVPKLTKTKTINDYILVYLSPYSDSNKYLKLIDILRQIQTKRFKIYSKNSDEYSKKFEDFSNLEFSVFNDEFKKNLASCEALITTGGHQLISEAIYLDVPLYVMPLDTYEQNYNALMVSKYKLGMFDNVSKLSIEKFINTIDKYAISIKKYKQKYYKCKWEEIVIDTINDVLNTK